MNDDALGLRCVEALDLLFPGVRSHYSGCRVLRTPFAYPVYRLEYEEARRRFAAGSGVENLYSIGRNGEFAHILMEDIYWRTIKKMNELIRALQADAHRPRYATETDPALAAVSV
jgi:protoporphyrinogen oxidase